MNKMLQKLVDQEVMPEEFGTYIDSGIAKKDSFIISGHKGWGILPLLASVTATAKADSNLKQVKKSEDLNDEAEYYMIGEVKDVDFEALVLDAICKPNSSVITIKSPEFGYSIMKVLKSFYKKTSDSSKTFHVLECAKEGDDKKLAKITTITFDENGKMKKVDL